MIILLKKSSICKEINNDYINIHLINNIIQLTHYIFTENNFITQELFDLMFYIIKDKKYLNNELKYFYNENNMFLDFIIKNKNMY